MQKEIVQVFEGYIDHIDPESGICTVILQDVTEPSNPDELAEIDFSTVNNNIDTVKEGYIFTWRMGCNLDTTGKQGNPFNEFEFVTETWTADELKEARAEAKRISELLKRFC